MITEVKHVKVKSDKPNLISNVIHLPSYVSIKKKSSRQFKVPFALCINVCGCTFENNRSNSEKIQKQRMGSGSVPILCVDINITMDTNFKIRHKR